MNIVLSDLQTVLMLLPGFSLIAALALYFEWRGRGPSRLLTRAEWATLAKLAAIPLMILVLVQAKAALELRPELFLYGRF